MYRLETQTDDGVREVDNAWPSITTRSIAGFQSPGINSMHSALGYSGDGCRSSQAILVSSGDYLHLGPVYKQKFWNEIAGTSSKYAQEPFTSSKTCTVET
ncbi:hypothetical protein ACLB2K_031714 [Fragaria x ananassa]